MIPSGRRREIGAAAIPTHVALTGPEGKRVCAERGAVGPGGGESSPRAEPLLGRLPELGIERAHGPVELFGLEGEPLQDLGL